MARPRKFHEDTVLLAAQQQFWSAGYAGTSLDDLSAATGLGRGSLYGAFGNKHDLYVRTLSAYCADAVGTAVVELTGAGSARDRLIGYIRGAATAIAGEKKRKPCMVAKAAAERGAIDVEVATRARGAFVGIRDALAECVTAAQIEGTLPRDLDPQRIGNLLLTVLRGLEAIGEGDVSAEMVNDAAEQALELLGLTPSSSTPDRN